MGILERSAAMVGFYGDHLDPSEITALLGGEPTDGARMGDAWRLASGREKTYPTGSWRLNAPDREPANLDEQIEMLFGGLTTDLGVWRELATRYRGVVFCGLFLGSQNEGVKISPPSLVTIGERGLTIDFDIYGPSVLE
jgi:hypothetical protein